VARASINSRARRNTMELVNEMVTRIHHLTFVVRNLDLAEEQYRMALGIEAMEREELPLRGVRTSRFRLGELWVVLVQPTGEGVPARHLREHGEGLLLVSYEVPDLALALADCVARGIAQDGPIRAGVSNWRVADLVTGVTPGVTTQLCEARI
jgi:methylmalonyl-CoA/ethylmalonyl-CoA epimerase